ncbi:MAG: hypothetical protein Q9196_002830 [Gyalolechia fulgens]
MVHYIRFLKSPRFVLAARSPKQVPVSALITITTDLGDAFYPGDLSVYTAIATRFGKISLGLTFWKSGMRCLKIETKVPLEYLTSWARLVFTCSESLEADSLQLGKVPYIVSAWTEEFRGPQDPIADAVVRRFTLLEGKVLEICEENGESIARHICIPHLAQTISELAQRSMELHQEALSPQVIVSTKKRHPSEAIFFDLMSKAGFEQKEHTTVSMHDQYRESIGQDVEVVDVYVFERARVQ